MSRSNTSAIRLIKRQEESFLLRKQVLKSKNALVTEDLIQTLSSSNDAYVKRMETLQKFQSKSKKESKLHNLKVDWLSEQSQLASTANKLENEIQSQVQKIFTTMPTDELIQGIIQDLEETHISRVQYQRNILSQWKELKEILQHTIHSLNKLHSKHPLPSTSSSNSFITDPSNQMSDSDTIQSQRWKNVFSLYADMLVNLLSSHFQKWKALKEEETILLDEVLQERNQIANMIREEQRINQDEKLFQDLLSHESDSFKDIHADVEIYVEEWLAKIQDMDKLHNDTLEELQQEKIAFCNQLHIDPNDRIGGWDESNHDIFYKIYRRGQQEGLSRKNLFSLLRSQLSETISLQEINLHEEWYRQIKVVANKKKDMIATYESKRFDMITKAKESVESYKITLKETKDKEIKLQEFNKFRQDIHERLDLLRQEQYINQIEKELRESELKEEERQRLEEEKRLKQEEINEKKRRVEEYYREKEIEEEKIVMEEKKRTEDEIKLRRQLIKENRNKVIDRNMKIMERIDERRNREMEIQVEEEKRLQKLLKLAEQVPYFDSIQSTTSKLDHITASVKGHEYIAFDPTSGEDGPLRLQRGHIPMNGFADQKIIRDTRLRLATALRAAGVIHTDAARAAIASFHPKPHLAIHGIL